MAASLKVILCDDVDNVGNMGDTVRVAPGYARNFLLPRKLAVLAESASAKQIEHELKIIKKREDKKRATLRDVAKVLEAVTVDIQVRAGEGDKLFGSVTNGNISERLAELGHKIDKKSIKLEEPIKHLGIFMVPVKLGVGVEAQVKVWVTGLAVEATAEVAPVEEEDDDDDDDE
jgi:large subunit ribosomal protein L9